jgi:23S rRNA (pseudouridine1915-N3)-methyltransferase
MKIQLWSVGKAHESQYKVAIEDFSKRISNYYPVEWKILAQAKQNVNSTEAIVKKCEAATILQHLSTDDYLVLLDERGKQLTSPELAKWLQLRANERTRQLIFLIAGAFGADESLLKRADFTWSLSPLVFPHQLVRIILAEQLYRACSINRNEKYHHQ